ncbi:MAG: hypothetical protein M8858_01005 [marine benthic group bacterium]|nr:hypothetical protein [Gemmatimonadota bacterium]
MADSVSRGNRRTAEALNRAGLDDPRPALRNLLRDLKERDPEAFGEATRRYQEKLAPSLASDGDDPVAAWLEYGCWLAQRVSPGKVVEVDATGRARPAPETPGKGRLFLHLPSDPKRKALVILAPLEPTLPQRETMALLAG